MHEASKVVCSATGHEAHLCSCLINVTGRCIDEHAGAKEAMKLNEMLTI